MIKIKHNLKVTLILIGMFLATQLIGLFVVYSYFPVHQQVMVNGTLQNVTLNQLPYGMEPPAVQQDISLISIVIAFVVAVIFVILLSRLKAALFLRAWFFVVVVLVLGISINALLFRFIPVYSQWISLALAIPLAVYKIYRRNIIVHNITELFVYPGIAAVFVPMLGIWSIVVLLLVISVYDIWAVWHSGIMQKMAQYQIKELKLFAGFFVPYLNKKQKALIKQVKLSDSKSKNLKSKKLKSMKVSLAILGGGDVVFPIITAGIIMNAWGIIPALSVSLCATLALFWLFVFAKKGKFYPAMPFITVGLLIGIGLAYLLKIFI